MFRLFASLALAAAVALPGAAFAQIWFCKW